METNLFGEECYVINSCKDFVKVYTQSYDHPWLEATARSSLVHYVILAILLAKIDFIGFFYFVGVQISQKYLGSMTPFYATIFKMASSMLNMTHNEHS